MTREELLDTVYRYYPRGIPSDDPRYQETPEYRRLAAARRQAGADREPWRALLRRLGDQFSENAVQDRSLHLPTGEHDACYSAWVYLPASPGEHWRVVVALRVLQQALSALLQARQPPPVRVPRRQVETSFDPSPEEERYFAGITQAIEATFKCERLPPEIGKVLVPDVATGSRSLGEATLYDCLLSDDW